MTIPTIDIPDAVLNSVPDAARTELHKFAVSRDLTPELLSFYESDETVRRFLTDYLKAQEAKLTRIGHSLGEYKSKRMAERSLSAVTKPRHAPGFFASIFGPSRPDDGIAKAGG